MQKVFCYFIIPLTLVLLLGVTFFDYTEDNVMIEVVYGNSQPSDTMKLETFLDFGGDESVVAIHLID